MFDVNDMKGKYRRVEVLTDLAAGDAGRRMKARSSRRRWCQEHVSEVAALASLFAAGIRLATRNAADLSSVAEQRQRRQRPASFRSSEAIPAATVQRTASAAPGIEVKLAGAVVRVSSGMDDAAQLTAVLRAVRASASRS